MVDVFYWVLNMSILGSLLGGLVLLIRKIKVLPRFFIYLLWGIVLIRLACPVGFVSGFSLLNLLPRGSSRMVPITSSKDFYQERLSYTNFVQNAKDYQPVVMHSDGLQIFYHVVSKVWMVVTVLLILGNIILYWITRREGKEAVYIKDRIYESNRISGPIVIGIIKPKILLPSGLRSEDKNVRYILEHEFTHLRRRDNLWRLISILIACFHWFNPFVWLFLARYFEDMELACDEGTLRRLKEGERHQYAETLLTYAKTGFFLHTASFGGSKVKVRIERVITYRNITFFSTLGLGLMFLILGVFLLSNR